MLDRLSLSPAGIVHAAAPGARRRVRSASAAVGRGVALLGVTAGSAIVGAAILLSAGLAALVARGFGPYTDYRRTSWSRTVALDAVALIALVASPVQAPRAASEHGRFAAAFSAAALFLKLLVLLHPEHAGGRRDVPRAPVSRRARRALYFTSIAPGGYPFPYRARPLRRSPSVRWPGAARRGRHGAAADRSSAPSTRSPALLLYAIVVRGWGDRLAGAMAVALYHLIPLDFAVVVTTGNLTNAFAQSVAVAALALMAARGRSRAPGAQLAAPCRVLAGCVPVTHRHVRDPRSRRHWWRRSSLVARRAGAAIGGARRSPRPCIAADPGGGRLLRAFHAAPTGPNSPASGLRPRRRRPTPAAARSAIGWRWCPDTRGIYIGAPVLALRAPRRRRASGARGAAIADADSGRLDAVVRRLSGARHPDAGRHALLPGGHSRRCRLRRAGGRAALGVERQLARASAVVAPRRERLVGLHAWWVTLGPR